MTGALHRFAPLVTVMEEDPSDENYAILKENRARLEHARDEKAGCLTLWSCRCRNRSFTRVNACRRVTPTFTSRTASCSCRPIGKERPARAGNSATRHARASVIGVDSTELIWGLGSFHCISQQERRLEIEKTRESFFALIESQSFDPSETVCSRSDNLVGRAISR